MRAKETDVVGNAIRRIVRRAIVLTLIAVSQIATTQAWAALVTIDMSDHEPASVFDRNFFQSDGVVFTEGSFVGFIQGDDALVFPGVASTERIAGLFAPAAITSLSIRVAPGTQGTAVYRLAALDVFSNIIDSKSVLVTQDTRDPENMGFGYVTIELFNLPGAVGFLVDNTFVRSFFPEIERIGAINGGLSSLTFRIVHEPGSLLLFGFWLSIMGFIAWSRRFSGGVRPETA